jgi:long-chain acyl-CoA synthetase
MPGNLVRLLEANARQWPDKTALIHDGEAVTWRRLDGRAGAVASSLAGQGIGPGDRVAVHLENPADLTAAVIGALKTGATVTPLNPRLTDDEREVIVTDLAPRFVVRALDDGGAEFASRDADGGATAFILYTSGSTGAPKGVMLSHDATAVALDHWRGPVMDLGEDDVVLSALPAAHSFGIFGGILAPLAANASVVFLARFRPEDALALISRHRVSVFPGVATMFRRILDYPGLAGADVSSLRFAVSGAAPCSWDLAEEWRTATGARIIRGYGMTELFRPISFAPQDRADVPDAIGRAVADVELRIAGADGVELGRGETGELWIKSPARLTGYYNRPEESAAVLNDGWFKTGDLAAISDDGFVQIFGRTKDIILRGGYTIAAGEVESVLESHPDIAEAAVIGVPHRELGEEIAAYVALRPGGRALDPDQIIGYCKDRLAGYKYPRQVHIRAALPKGPTGKIAKSRLLGGS